jgi:Domain of unknown function (DUF6285)
MQFLPDAADLLAAIGKLLDEKVLHAVPPEVQHEVRVAANLTSLVEREIRLGTASTAREKRLLADVLGEHEDDPHAVLADRIRNRDDEGFEERVWPVLVEITRGDLDVAKPGHEHWQGV